MNKILFPFYKSVKYGFLMKKWWFRFLLVIFMIVFLLSIIFIINDNTHQWGYDWETIGGGIAFLIVIFYLFQLFFFKIVIDFIALGNDKNKE